MTGSVVCRLWHRRRASCWRGGPGFQVVGLDRDERRVTELQAGRPPIAEPRLAELVQGGLSGGSRSRAIGDGPREGGILWVDVRHAVDEDDRADVAGCRAQLDAVRPHVQSRHPGAGVVAGARSGSRRGWSRRGGKLTRASSSPARRELGSAAIEVFGAQEQVVRRDWRGDRWERLAGLFAPFSGRSSGCRSSPPR